MWRFVQGVALVIITGITGKAVLLLLARLGMKPEEWLVDLGFTFVTPDNIEIGLIGLSIILGLALAAAIVWAPLPVIALWSRVFEKQVAMRDAARITYEETRGGELADMAHRLNPGNILTYYADYLRHKAPIRGKAPPSTKVELIDQKLIQSTRFSESCNELAYIQEREPLYIDVTIGERDLKRVIAELKAGDKPVARAA